VEEYLGDKAKARQDEWTGSIAVGSRSFVDTVKTLLGFRAKGRDVIGGGAGYNLREEAAPYTALFGAEKDDIGLENTHFWDLDAEKSSTCGGPTPDSKPDRDSRQKFAHRGKHGRIR
jgi:hypothetical protein